ncbi:MAG: ketosteroid isomerase-related protein [Pseudomonadota bacterium]|nr:ketosteroid isomerase-related protein [Pseudomonadota bacterium]
MSRAAHELLQSYYAAFNAGDWNRFVDLLADDVVHDINQGGRELGRDAFIAFMHRMNRCYRERIENIEIMSNPDGTRCAVEFTVLGTYLNTDEGLPEARGQAYRLPGGAFFELRAGKVVRISNYYNLQDWLTQVGTEA